MDLVESYKEELRFIRKPWTGVWVFTLLAALLLLPFYAPDFMVYIAAQIFIFSIGAQGQNILIGYTGQISFGQAGFLAIGAFTFGHLAGAGVPLPLALLAAGLMTGFFGLLVGIPALRLKGPYLAVATLGFGVAVYQVFVNSELLSGGRMGLVVNRLSPPFGLATDTFNFYFYFVIAMAFMLLTYNIISSYMGRAFIAIRDNDIAAEIMGVNLARYKLLAFFISSFYTGVHGALLGLFLGYLEPNMFTLMAGLELFVAIVIGGLGAVEGSIMGAAFVILVPQFLSGYREFVPVIYGVTIILVLIFEPHGLYGRWFKMRLYLRNWPFR